MTFEMAVFALVEAGVILLSVYLGFYVTKTAYTYNNPALGNPNGTDNSVSVTPYDQDPTDEIYSMLGDLGKEPKDDIDPVAETVSRFMKVHGVNPADTLGPTDVPSAPFTGEGVEEIADDDR